MQPPENPDALYRATDIHRRYERRDWPAAIECVPEHQREEVRAYLWELQKRILYAREAKARNAQAKASVARDQPEPQGKRGNAARA